MTVFAGHKLWGQFVFKIQRGVCHTPTERNTRIKEMRQEAQQWKKQLRVNHTHMHTHTYYNKDKPE